MAREVFIVACLELGLHPDLSTVRWNMGSIDLDHFGLGDQLAGALAARCVPHGRSGFYSRPNHIERTGCKILSRKRTKKMPFLTESMSSR